MIALFKILVAWVSFLFVKERPQPVTETAGEVELPDVNDCTPEMPEIDEHNDISEPDEIIIPETHNECFSNKKVVLLDNGHAECTPGKRSPVLPDGRQFFEYEFNRDIVRRISEKLNCLGIENHILVPEVKEDVGLSKRAARANEYCDKYGCGNCIFISVHANAAGCGCWENARGWSIWTTRGNTNSDKYATIFYEEAAKILPLFGMTLRSDMSDGDPDWEDDFTVIYKAKCPAVLTENLFMDNIEDVKFLLSEEGREIIAQIHVNAIKRICS